MYFGFDIGILGKSLAFPEKCCCKIKKYTRDNIFNVIPSRKFLDEDICF